MHITGDALQDDFMFNRAELDWLRKSWKEATGRQLKHPSMTAEEQLLQAGFVHKVNGAGAAQKKGAKISGAKRVSKKN